MTPRTNPPPPSPTPEWPETALVAAARRVAAQLTEAGHEAFFVGGAVRNWLLGEAIDDVDVATSAPPDEVTQLFRRTQGVGAHFGVVLVTLGDHVFEVATFRAEGHYTDRRRPDTVRYGTLDEDYRRRDFTINALYYDPGDGRLLDPADGRRDLERRILRTVGDPDRRFDEDALRLMRAVRFAARYALAIDPPTLDALAAHAARADALDAISAERIGEELLRILTGPHPGDAMRQMGGMGLWPHIVPEVAAMAGCTQPPQFHPEGDVFTHTALTLDHLAEAWPDAEPPAALALSALLHDVGKPPTRRIDDDGRIRFCEHARVGARMAGDVCRRLRYSNRLGDAVAECVGQHMRFMDVQNMRPATLRRFLALDAFDRHLALHRADCLASHGKLDNYEFCLRKRAEWAETDRQAQLMPPPLVTGRDLIDRLGWPPGPEFGPWLERARDEQLEGRLATRDEALAWLRRARQGED